MEGYRMVDVDEAAPADIVDRLLWRDAQQMLSRHVAAGSDGTCVWCGWRWPCSARRLAERAEAVARQPFREAWTLRHDLNSVRGTSAHGSSARSREEQWRLVD
jgi:hypothetical protein